MEAFTCGICTDRFDFEQRKPLIGSCGHSYCASCIQIIGDKCPHCNQISFRNAPFNREVLNLMGANNGNHGQNNQQQAPPRNGLFPSAETFVGATILVPITTFGAGAIAGALFTMR